MAQSHTSNKFLLIVAVVVALISIISAGVAYYSIASFKDTWLTGYATSTGTINLTVESSATVTFTVNNITWTSGRVFANSTHANLTSLDTNNVSGGNFTLLTPGGLRLRNTGNVNVTLNLSVGKTAANFLGGTNPLYQWNLTEVESGSCLNATYGTILPGSGFINLSNFHDTRTAETPACRRFPFDDARDDLRIDIYLRVPSDSFSGALSDTITATFEQAP